MSMMHAVSAAAIVVCGIAIVEPAIAAGDLSRYRAFELGSSLASVSKTADVAPASAKTLHQRPAVLQELEWRPPHWSADSAPTSNDPVEQVVFTFYNDQLFRVVVDYAHDRTEGLTGADLIDAISETYGPAVARPAAARPAARVTDSESGMPLAHWAGGDFSLVLYRRSAYRETFRLVLTATTVENLAKKAAAQSARLDAQEAPQREIARQKKEKDEGVAAAEKARIANKRQFRP
ncbi:MAG TPA: hypothetical protein VEU08_00950 [Vicinamibacterales bacterium]|nr:hypothetical protein [Vicinamibacterales bacterium]